MPDTNETAKPLIREDLEDALNALIRDGVIDGWGMQMQLAADTAEVTVSRGDARLTLTATTAPDGAEALAQAIRAEL